MLHDTFKVMGTVSRYGSGGIVIVDEVETNRPVMMEAYEPMMKYIDEQSSSDLEEKYMPLEFVYDGWCNLIGILVPSTDERIPAKAVILTKDCQIKIFGEQEIISKRINEPMKRDDWYAFRNYMRDVEEYKI